MNQMSVEIMNEKTKHRSSKAGTSLTVVQCIYSSQHVFIFHMEHIDDPSVDLEVFGIHMNIKLFGNLFL